jgi:hypothetical protein
MRSASSRDRREHGQIIVLFAFGLVALLAMGALLFTGAQTLVARRQLQNAGDAAALAGANAAYNAGGCSTSSTGPTVTAVKNSISQNLPGFDLSNLRVSCPTKTDPIDGSDLYRNYAVQVDLSGAGPGYFGAAAIGVSTSSVAVNGATGHGEFSVALLDPANPNWKHSGGGTGCASFTYNGGATAYFEGSIMIDSACLLSDSSNGAMKIVNNAATLVMKNDSPIRIVGEYASGTDLHVRDSSGNLLPPIQQHGKPPVLPDPLAPLRKPCGPGEGSGCTNTGNPLPSYSLGTVCSGSPCVLNPGIYTPQGNNKSLCAGTGNGCQAPVLLLRPGLYYLYGTGITNQSSGSIYAIPNANANCGYPVQKCTDAWAKAFFGQSDTTLLGNGLTVGQQWASDCSLATSVCGVLLYNAPGSSGKWSTNGSDAINIGAQGVVRLRGYNPVADTTVNGGTTGVFARNGYANLVMWQARQPAPGPNMAQTGLNLGGGGTFVISGTVYAPGAAVKDSGNPGGCGGCDSDETVQYICWDLTLAGNTTYYFAYRKQYFAQPLGYGLVQ